MRRRRSRASADDGGKVARVLESLAQSQVHLGVWDGGEAKASLGGIVQVCAHRGEVDERHGDRSLRRLALRQVVGRRKGADSRQAAGGYRRMNRNLTRGGSSIKGLEQ